MRRVPVFLGVDRGGYNLGMRASFVYNIDIRKKILLKLELHKPYLSVYFKQKINGISM